MRARRVLHVFSSLQSGAVSAEPPTENCGCKVDQRPHCFPRSIQIISRFFLEQRSRKGLGMIWSKVSYDRSLCRSGLEKVCCHPAPARPRSGGKFSFCSNTRPAAGHHVRLLSFEAFVSIPKQKETSIFLRIDAPLLLEAKCSEPFMICMSIGQAHHEFVIYLRLIDT